RCRPGVGRDPGKSGAQCAHGAHMPGLGPPPERRRWGSHRREKRSASELVRLKYVVVPAEAGIQAKSSAPCTQRPGLRPPPERRRWGSHRREKRSASELVRLKYVVVPA